MGGLRVIACDRYDGLYYSGTITKRSDSTFAIVTFNNKKQQKVRTQMIIPMSGAIARPELSLGDFVLVRVYNENTHLECYVPGIVEHLPENCRQHNKFYSILLYNGQRETTLRRLIVKIGKERFNMAIRYITHLQQQRVLREQQALSDNSTLPSPKSTSSKKSDDETISQHSSQSGRGRRKKEKLTKRLKDNKENEKHTKSKKKSRSRSGSRTNTSVSSMSSRSSRASRSSRSRSRSSRSSRSRSSSKSRSRSRSGDSTSRRSYTGSESSRSRTPKSSARTQQSETPRSRSRSSSGSHTPTPRRRRAASRSNSDSSSSRSRTPTPRRNNKSSKQRRSSSRSKSYSSGSRSRTQTAKGSKKSSRRKASRSSSPTPRRNKKSSRRRRSSTRSNSYSSGSRSRSPTPRRRKRSASKSSSESSRSRSNGRKSKNRSNGKSRMSRSRSRSSSSSSTVRSRSFEKKQKKGRPSKSRKERSRSPSAESRSRSRSRSDGSSTPRNRSPFDRPHRPEPRTQSEKSMRKDIYHERNCQSVEQSESRMTNASHIVNVDAKDEIIQELQQKLEKQTRKQLRQEMRLVRQARKINKIQIKMRSTDTLHNDSTISSHAEKSDREKSVQSSFTETEVKSPRQRKGSPDGTSYHESVDLQQLVRSRSNTLLEQEVLARWTDDGWYYSGYVIGDKGDEQYIVKDSTGYKEVIQRDDILTSAEHSYDTIQPEDFVIGLHPKYAFSYAPAEVLTTHSNYCVKVEFFDGNLADLNSEDIYKISKTKYYQVVDYIKKCEKCMVGQSVVARDDNSGLYKLGVIDSRVDRGQLFYIKWLDGDMSTQNGNHIFEVAKGQTSHDKWRYVLAPISHNNSIFLPAVIVPHNPLVIQFCDGRSTEDVQLDRCFWISEEYYQNAAAFLQDITDRN